jgi:hypothetical protein
VVPLPREDVSWLSMWALSLANRQQWSRHPALMQWLGASRLDYGTQVRDQVSPELMQRYMTAVKAAAPRIPGLLQQAQPRRAEPAVAA